MSLTNKRDTKRPNICRKWISPRVHSHNYFCLRWTKTPNKFSDKSESGCLLTIEKNLALVLLCKYIPPTLLKWRKIEEIECVNTNALKKMITEMFTDTCLRFIPFQWFPTRCKPIGRTNKSVCSTIPCCYISRSSKITKLHLSSHTFKWK